MAPKLSTLARNLFLQELDQLPRGMELKRKAQEEGGDSKKIACRFASLKLADWYSCSEDDQSVFFQKARSQTSDGGEAARSQPTLRDLFSQSSSLPPLPDELSQTLVPVETVASADTALDPQCLHTLRETESDDCTLPASDSQLVAVGRSIMNKTVPEQTVADSWPHDRQPDTFSPAQPPSEVTVETRVNVPPLNALSCQDDGLPHYLQRVQVHVASGNLMGAFQALEAVASDIGYVGDDFMRSFLEWAIACAPVRVSSPREMADPVATSARECTGRHDAKTVDGMWRLFAANIPAPGMFSFRSEENGVGRTHAPVDHAVRSYQGSDGQYRRLLKSMPPRGKLPDQNEILGLAAQCGLYVHESQFKELKHGSSVVGFQLATPCLSAFINVWPSSGRIHIAGRDRSVGLRFVECFTIPDPKPPRSRKSQGLRPGGNRVPNRSHLSPREALRLAEAMNCPAGTGNATVLR